MTVHTWGESPVGKWTLEIHNEGRYTGKIMRIIQFDYNTTKYTYIHIADNEHDNNASYNGDGLLPSTSS